MSTPAGQDQQNRKADESTSWQQATRLDSKMVSAERMTRLPVNSCRSPSPADDQQLVDAVQEPEPNALASGHARPNVNEPKARPPRRIGSLRPTPVSSQALFTWLRLTSASGLLLGVLILTGCSEGKTDAPAPSPQDPVTIETTFDFKPAATLPENKVESRPLRFPDFADAAAEIGINHTYENGASPRALMVEATGGGAGWFDLDHDGLPDLYLSQGGVPDVAPSERRPDSCFRQLPNHQFTDVAAACGIQERGYGHGVAIADVNNDGFDDIFVANVGKNSLYINAGDGTFFESSDWLQGGRDVWSSSAAWGDIDRDGDLDLYVCNYAMYDPLDPVECLDKDGIPSICHPRNVDPEADEFFLNDGAGNLTEASRQFGLFGPGNKALGIVIADLTGDRWPDIFVANDTTANFFFVNEEGTHFRESALSLGGAFSGTGATQASMGIAFGDYDNNQWPDLCLSHFTGEANTLYQNLGPQGLQDVSALTGLRQPTLPKLGFGTIMADLNADAAMDLVVANGHIDPRYAESEGYEMTPQLFSFDGARWQEGSSESGPYFTQAVVGRSIATADYDQDGDIDLCIVHHNSPTVVLRNESTLGNWIQVRLIGRKSNRDGIGVRVKLNSEQRTQVQELAGGTSYSATHQKQLYFGLADDAGPFQLSVEWPSGMTDTVDNVSPGRVITLIEEFGPIDLAEST